MLGVAGTSGSRVSLGPYGAPAVAIYRIQSLHLDKLLPCDCQINVTWARRAAVFLLQRTKGLLEVCLACELGMSLIPDSELVW